MEIGHVPPGWIVVAAADLRSPLLLPEQAKMCESSLFTRGFTHFGSFRGKRMAPEPKLRRLYIFLFHFAPLILWPPAYEFCGFSQKRGHRSPCDFTTEKWPRPRRGQKRANQRIIKYINSLKVILIRMCFSHFYPFKEILFITHFRFIIQLNVPQNAKIFLKLSNFYLKFIQFIFSLMKSSNITSSFCNKTKLINS